MEFRVIHSGHGAWGCKRLCLPDLSNVFIIFMEHLFFSKRFILGVVLVNFWNASMWNYATIGFKNVNPINPQLGQQIESLINTHKEFKRKIPLIRE